MMSDESVEERMRVWVWDEKRTLDYKYLGDVLSLHANVGKQHLYSLVSKCGSELDVRYSVSGIDEEGRLRVCIVPKEELESLKSSLLSLSSVSVHSLSLKGHYEQGMGFGENYTHLRSSIRNKSVAIKETIKDEAVTSALNSNSESKPETSKGPAEQQNIKKEPNVLGNKSQTEIKSKTISKSLNPSSQPPKKGLVGMWEKAVEKKAAQKENRMNEKKEEKELKNSARARSRSSSSQNKKRKRVQVFSDSESEEEGKDNDEEKEDALRSQESVISAPVKIESEDSEEEIPATPCESESSKKRKVRKEVTKMYTNDEGYMITKREFELQSEDEESPPQATNVAAESKATAKSSIKPVISKPKISPKKKPNKNNKQASIMNFFMKK